MGARGGPQSIVQDGLVFAADAANPISWASPSSTDVNDLINPPITGSTYNDNSPGALDGGVGYWEFDGSDDYIKFPDNDVINPSGWSEVTVECWINPSSYVNYGTVFEFGKPIHSPYYGLTVFSRTSYFEFAVDVGKNSGAYDGIRVNDNGIVTHSTDTWFHVVGVYDGIAARIYTNTIAGTTSAHTGGTIVGGANPTLIGEGTVYFYAWNGKVGYIRIYNKALSVAEITQNYNATKNRFQ